MKLIASIKINYLSFLFFLLLGYSSSAYAQISIGVDGLTCSMCSNSIYRLLLQTPGVMEIKMDLNENVAEVYYKKNATPNYKELSQKVFDAGYSVRFIKVKLPFEEFEATKGSLFVFEGNKYIYIGDEDRIVKNAIIVTLIGKNYNTKKEFKEWRQSIQNYKNQLNDNSYFFTF